MDKAEKIWATVIGSRRVAGVDPGGTVELDPSRVNVEGLVEAGHIALTPAKPRRRPERPEQEEETR